MRYFSFLCWSLGYFIGSYFIGGAPLNVAINCAIAMFTGCFVANLFYGRNK